MIGCIVTRIHKAYHLGKSELLVLSNALCDDSLQNIANNHCS
jgi:hypothetical protein